MNAGSIFAIAFWGSVAVSGLIFVFRYLGDLKRRFSRALDNWARERAWRLEQEEAERELEERASKSYRPVTIVTPALRACEQAYELRPREPKRPRGVA